MSGWGSGCGREGAMGGCTSVLYLLIGNCLSLSVSVCLCITDIIHYWSVVLSVHVFML